MLLFNHVHFQANESMNTFQNILCYCLTSTFSALWTLCCISKHPMLLFNTGICVKTTTIQLISKHPMLLFNCFPLCRTSCSRLFQNILCYCLTCQPVNVYPFSAGFQNILCYCLTRVWNWKSAKTNISKHPMLLFNH